MLEAFPDRGGPLELLIFQVTPFCNIDCRYCYLPERGSKRVAHPAVLEDTLRFVAEGGLARRPFTISWHAGEPLAAPKGFYQAAGDILQSYQNRLGVRITQALQTNATLIDNDWCEHFLRHGVRVGVSLDGPAFLHDRQRVTRSGAPTHQSVLRGVKLLQRHGVPFSVIAVLTDGSLDYADEVFSFFVECGIREVGFNIDEIDGANRHSSMTRADAADRFRAFFSRLFRLNAANAWPLRVREIRAFQSLLAHDGGVIPTNQQQVVPFQILAVDSQGYLSTFSPELLATQSLEFGDFRFGHVSSTSLETVYANPRFQRAWRDIRAGVDMCRSRCRYFTVCGGGHPANKYCEHGTFRATETTHCRLRYQALSDVLLAELERHYGEGPQSL